MKRLLVPLAGLTLLSGGAGQTGEIPITVHANRLGGELKPIWRFFGYDEANYTYGEEGRRMLAEIAKLRPQPVYIRCHNLLNSGAGEAWLKWSSTGVYDEDAQGRPVYRWDIFDHILDTYRDNGLKPYFQFGFMPKALSSHPEDYAPPKVMTGSPRGVTGGGAFYPSKDYKKWEAMVEEVVRHCVERYGREEAESWWWEMWNEANARNYWRGTREEFLRLYDHTAAGVKRVLPHARIGGPEVARSGAARPEEKTGLTRDFLEHCARGTNAATGGKGAPLDFLSFHAKGGVSFVDGHVNMNLGNHLKTIDEFCGFVDEFPEFKKLPVVIGESDPDGSAATSAKISPERGYRNTAQYASYTAATFMRKQDVAALHGMSLEGAITWAFVFEDQPWFEGFRVLATRNVVLPVFNAFRMFSLLEKQRVDVENPVRRGLDDLMKSGVLAAPDVDAVATRGERSLAVLVWHYHDSAAPGPDEKVALALAGLPADVRLAEVSHWRIDADHSNSYTAWLKMGSPENPTAEQQTALRNASDLALIESPHAMEIREGGISMRFAMPRQSVSLIRLKW
ncbi:MAG: beta-xylosidase [Candidatus Sumerlaeota bacterium]|nr:beta-xylosidase [Candidatus Sumerlaeota bacterium]